MWDIEITVFKIKIVNVELDLIKRYLWSQNNVGHSKLILVKKQTNNKQKNWKCNWLKGRNTEKINQVKELINVLLFPFNKKVINY